MIELKIIITYDPAIDGTASELARKLQQCGLHTRLIAQKVEKKPSITIDDIIKKTCDYYGITPEEMLMKKNKGNPGMAKHIVRYFAKTKLPRTTLATISKATNCKNHSATLHSIRTLQDVMTVDKSLKKEVAEIGRILG